MAEKDADVQKLKELIKIMKENDLVRIDIRHGEDYISLQRAQPQPLGTAMGPMIASLPGLGTPIIVPQTAAGGQAGAPIDRKSVV
jgi:hypothetical protein